MHYSLASVPNKSCKQSEPTCVNCTWNHQPNKAPQIPPPPPPSAPGVSRGHTVQKPMLRRAAVPPPPRNG